MLLAITLPALAIKVKSDELHLFASGSSDGVLHYIVSKKDIANISEWNGTGAPPMSADRATSLVRNEHRKTHGNIDTTIRKISLSSKETYCNLNLQCPKVLWYYKVKVKGDVRATYVLLLNGEFVYPREK